ncbi:MAG TPA: CopG family transcriptional regulator [Alteromonas australica]|uniref:CopG family transcriptional regulator n=2 Tax=Alteromonadales TaxID=135622 RepID=A0A350PA53_9ALTE|nr:CopG family transcriptional regulator [Alteromonas sp.]HAI70806.1 CopG family transcriptional regulator [Alteromonas australica]HAR55253.1 CopG family transcriptional regulator [Idiomarina baltica]HAW78170.1 CopG family transcriptional regulator [Alteromonas australica]
MSVRRARKNEVERPNLKQKRINVDFPEWVIDSLDQEASRIGVTRQPIIKMWLVERLEAQEATRRLK